MPSSSSSNDSYRCQQTFPQHVPIPIAITVRNISPSYQPIENTVKNVEEVDLLLSDESLDEMGDINEESQLSSSSTLLYHNRGLHNKSLNTFTHPSRRLFPSSDSFLSIRIDILLLRKYFYDSKRIWVNSKLNTTTNSTMSEHMADESHSPWIVLASYYKKNTLCSCNMTWNHLDECLYNVMETFTASQKREDPVLHTESIEEDLDIQQQIWREWYPHMWVQVSVFKDASTLPGGVDGGKSNEDYDDDDDELEITNREKEIQSKDPMEFNSMSHHPICMTPLYPDCLMHVVGFPRTSTTHSTSGSLEISRTEDMTYFPSPWTLPECIPPNSIFILFSDGVTRCAPACHTGDEMSEMSHVYESRPIPNMNGRKSGSCALSKPDMTFNPCKIPSPSDFGDMEDYIDEYSDTHLQAEVELLESILYQEQQLYSEEINMLEMNCAKLKSIQEKTETAQDETKQLQSQLSQCRPLLDKKCQALHSQQRKLLSDLRSIYPIQLLPDQVYTIGGIPLPLDLYSLVSSDEMISTALGYICHLVFMSSKYLNIPLRYRLICNVSRSVIQDDNNGIFPLFKDPMVDREQIDNGIMLLEQNINVLFIQSGIPVMTNDTPILVKVDELLSSLCGKGCGHGYSGWKNHQGSNRK